MNITELSIRRPVTTIMLFVSMVITTKPCDASRGPSHEMVACVPV